MKNVFLLISAIVCCYGVMYGANVAHFSFENTTFAVNMNLEKLYEAVDVANVRWQLAMMTADYTRREKPEDIKALNAAGKKLDDAFKALQLAKNSLQLAREIALPPAKI